MKREVKCDGGEDELDIVAVSKSGTEEACSKAACMVALVRDCLGERRFPCPCLPAEPQDTKLGLDFKHGRRRFDDGERLFRDGPVVHGY